MVRRLQQRAREHSEKFRWRIHRQVERVAADGLIALFAAILPTRPAVLDFETFFDWGLHVINAVAIVFHQHTGTVEFPGSRYVIAAAAIVIGIFSPHRPVRLAFHGLRASRVALNKNFVGAFRCGHLVKSQSEPQ